VVTKLFGGATYDAHVAGIASQNSSGSLNVVNLPVTPVRITAAGEVGYYAGLGLVVKFGL
jgi:hypothetical protein